MEYQLSTAQARAELQALEQAAQNVDRAFQQSSRSVDDSAARMANVTRGVPPINPQVAQSAEQTAQAANRLGQSAPQVSLAQRALGALSAVNLSGVAASVTNFAGALATVTIPAALNSLGAMFSSVAAQAGAAAAPIGGSIGGIIGSLGSLGGAVTAARASWLALIAVLTGGVLYGFSSGVQDAAAMVEKFRATITATTGSQQQAAEQWEFVRKVANATATDLEQVSKSYTRFSIAAQQSGLSLQTTQDIFQKLASTFRVFQLDAKSTGLAFLAFEQMINKGKVSMEELRRQLGEHLPGAMGAMAKALGVSVGQLDEMVRNGELGVDAVRKMVDQLHADFGSRLPEALKTAQAQFQILANTTLSLRAAFGTAFNQEIIPALQRFIAILQSPGLERFASSLGSLFGALGGVALNAINVLANAIGVLGSAIGPVVGLINSGLVLALEAVGGALGMVAGALGSVQTAIAGFSYGVSFAFEFVKVVGGDVVSALASAASAVYGWASALFSLEGVSNILAYIHNLLADLVGLMGDIGGGLLAAPFEYARQVFDDFAQSVVDLIGDVSDLFGEFGALGSIVRIVAGAIREGFGTTIEWLQWAFEGVKSAIKGFIDWLMKIPGVAAALEYFGSVASRVRARLEEKAAAAKRAKMNAQELGSTMNDAASKGDRLAASLGGVASAAMEAATAMKSLQDFGDFGFPDDIPEPGWSKKSQKLADEFARDYEQKWGDKAGSRGVKPSGGGDDALPDQQMQGESYANWAKRIYGVDILSGRELSSNRNFFDTTMRDQGGVAVEANTQAIREAIQAYERNAGVVQDNTQRMTELTPAIDNVGTGITELGGGLTGIGESIIGVGGSIDNVGNGIDGLNIGVGDLRTALGDSVGTATELIGATVNATDATGNLNEGLLDTNDKLDDNVDALGNAADASQAAADASYYAGEASYAAADAATDLSSSMIDAAGNIADAVGNMGDGGGSGQEGGGSGQDEGYVETPEFSGGGISHKKRPTRRVPISAFTNAPRFEDGGIPSILHPNEAVIPLSGGAVPVQISGGGSSALSTALLTTISESLRSIHQTMMDGQLLDNNIGTLAHNDAVKTHNYLQLIQDVLAEQVQQFATMISSFDEMAAKLAEFTAKVESAMQATRSGGGSAGSLFGSRSFSGGGDFSGDIAAEYARYGLKMPRGYRPRSLPDGQMGGGMGESISPRDTPVKWEYTDHGWDWVRNESDEWRGNLTANKLNRAGFAHGSPNAERDMRGGFMAMLHPDEAVVPLPDGRSIPVDLQEDELAERIITAMGNRGSGNSPTLVVHGPLMVVNTPDAKSFGASQDQTLREFEGKMRRAVENLGRANTVDDPTRLLPRRG